MPKYKVWATQKSACWAIIEADSENDAWDLAEELQHPSDWDTDPGWHYDIDSVEEYD